MRKALALLVTLSAVFGCLAPSTQQPDAKPPAVETIPAPTAAPPSACSPNSNVRDGAWDVQDVPLTSGASWVIAALGGEGPPTDNSAARSGRLSHSNAPHGSATHDNSAAHSHLPRGGASHSASSHGVSLHSDASPINPSHDDSSHSSHGGLLVQLEEGGAFERLSVSPTAYVRLAAGQAKDEQVQLVAASMQGLEWVRVNPADLGVTTVSLPAPKPGQSFCADEAPTSVAIVDPGCGEGLLVAASYYSRENYWCGGVRLFRLEGDNATLVRSIDRQQGVSKVQFFDVDADGKVDLVGSRRMPDRNVGTWGDVWLTPHDGCLSDVDEPTNSLSASYLARPDGCALAVADFDVARLQAASDSTPETFFATAFTAHELATSPNCWTATSHGGYSVVTDAKGEFLTVPRRLEKYEGTTGPQLMAHAVAFQSQLQPGSVRVATGYFRGASSTDPQGCVATYPCPGPALLETFALEPASMGNEEELAPPTCPGWLGYAQRLDAAGQRNEELAPAHEINCTPGADGVELSGVNIARVVSVVSGSEASLKEDSQNSSNQESHLVAQKFSFWPASSWVALDAKIVECVRVDYLVAQAPSVWAANVENQEPQRLTR